MAINIEKEIKKYFPNREIETQSPYLPTWQQWYKGYDATFHNYQVYTGRDWYTREYKKLKIAKKACEDYANLLLNEKCDIIIKDKDKLDDILYSNNFWVNANNLIEVSFALSMGAFVESIENLSVNDNGYGFKSSEARVKIEYVNATKIYPLTFANGKLIECAFATENTNETIIVIHRLNELNEYDIINLKYNNNGDLLQEYVFHTRSKKPLYQIIKPNICNNLDIESSLPVSIFANAIDILKAIDMAYDALDTEIQLGRRRIVVSEDLIELDENGDRRLLFNPNDIVYQSIPKLSGEDKRLLEEFASPLRIMDLQNALQEQLNTFASCVGFGKNYYTFGNSGGGRPIQTATGIIAQNTDLYRSIKKHEILLEQTLIDLVEAIGFLVNEYTTDSIDIDGVTIKFDDSIIEDKESQKASDRIDLQNGIISKSEYRQKWLAEDEEVANEKLDKFSLNDIDVRIANLLTPLTSGAMTPADFVELAYKGYDDSRKQEIVNYVTEYLSKENQPIQFDTLGVDVNE